MNSNGNLLVDVLNSAGTAPVNLITSAATISNTPYVWYYAAVTWQVSGSNLTCTLYVQNGSQLSTYTNTVSDFKSFTAGEMAIGSTYSGNNPLNGLISLAAYSKNVLSSSDISSMFQIGRGSSVNTVFDELGRPVESKIKTGNYTNAQNGGYTTSYSYLTGIGGSSTSRLGQITNNGTAIVYGYDTNDSYNNIKTITQPLDGTNKTITYHYNELNELKREDNPFLKDQNGDLVGATIVYTYDAGGNITSKVEYALTDPGTTPSNPRHTYTYTYDTTWKDKFLSYNGGSTMTYATIGNLTNDGSRSYTWEEGRNLISISDTGLSASYKYNDQGIRIAKTVGGVTTRYHLEGDRVTYEDNGTDKIYYTYDAGGSLVSMNLNGAEYYYIKNGQGDIIGLFDSTGTEVVSYIYDTWGKLVRTTGTSSSTVGVKNPYRYRQYRYDTETGYYYCQSRYYVPEWSRFISTDDISNCKLGEPLSFNLYAYCNNNPMNMIDTNGRYGWIIFGAVLGGVVNGGFQIVTNIAQGKKWSDGLLGSLLGGAVSGAILSINPAATVLAASLGATVQTVTNNLVDAISNHKKIDMAFVWNTVAQTIVAAVLGAAAGKLVGKAIPINKGWIKPDRIMSILTGAYGQKFRDSTILSGMLNAAFNIFTTKQQ